MNRNLNYPKLGVQHDLEKHPSNRAKTGWHISTRRQAYQSRVGRSQWLAKPNLLQAAGRARPSTAICLLFAILWVRWYVYFVPLPKKLYAGACFSLKPSSNVSCGVRHFS